MIPSPSWGGPGGSLTAWDLMQPINVRYFIDAGEVLRLVDQGLLALSPTGLTASPLPKQQFDSTLGLMKALLQHSQSLGLLVTPGLAEKFIKTAESAGTVTVLDAFTAISGARESFKVELESRMFLQVFSHRVPYYTREHSQAKPFAGHEITNLLKALDGFKDAHFDAVEAGNCLAFGRFTAAVYHLMRIAEYGLVAVASAAGVPDIEHRSWDKMLAGIHRHIKTVESQSKGNWLQERKRFSDLCSWLTVIKSGWRNPVSHIPRSYNEPTAMSMFAAVKTLFEVLTKEGFAQAQMPEGLIDPDDEAASSSKQLPAAQPQIAAPTQAAAPSQ